VRRVWVERTKWGGIPHYGSNGWLLGEDEVGRWVGLPRDRDVMRGEEVLFRAQHAAVLFVPHDDWYMVHWLDGHEIEVYVDIVTPPTWDERGATMVDLDFDVIVAGGEVTLVDSDEFEEHRVTLGYPDDLVADARRAAADVLARVERAEHPFTLAAGAPWHEKLAALA
jgi:protein associated with RNAse G/E